MCNLIERVIDKILGYEPPKPEPYIPPEPVPADYEFTNEDKKVLARAAADIQACKARYASNMSNMNYACSTGTPNWTRPVLLPNGKYVMMVDNK